MKRLLKGAFTLLRFVAVGFRPVSQEEALFRAIICQQCVLNQPSVKLHRLIKFVSWHVMFRVGKRGHFKSTTLNHCELCGCYLPLKIWVPEDQLKTPPDLMVLKPSHCWLK